jgi:hypothetical protein
VLEKPLTRRSRWTLDAIKRLPCAVHANCFGPVDPAHIRSRGAGGPDVPQNLVPLCRKHHSEQHQMGWAKFTLHYPQVWEAMVKKGWEWEGQDFIRGKLINKELRGDL